MSKWFFTAGMVVLVAVSGVMLIAAKTEVQRHNFPDRLIAIQDDVKKEEAALNNLGAPGIAAQVGATLSDWNALLSQIATYSQSDSAKAAIPLGNQLLATGSVFDKIGESQDAINTEAAAILERMAGYRVELVALRAMAQSDVDSTGTRADAVYAKWLVEVDPTKRQTLQDDYDAIMNSKHSLETTRDRLDYSLKKLDDCVSAVNVYLASVERLVNMIKNSGDVYFNAGTAIKLVGLSNQDYMGALPNLGTAADDLKNTWGQLATLVDEFGKIKTS